MLAPAHVPPELRWPAHPFSLESKGGWFFVGPEILPTGGDAEGGLGLGPARVNQNDVVGVGGVLVEELQGLLGVEAGTAVGDDLVVINDVVERGLERRAGLAVGSGVVGRRVRRPSGGEACEQENEGWNGDAHAGGIYQRIG
jgi:hypothetical protein